MNTYAGETRRSGSWATAMSWWRRRAWLLIVIADVGLLLWGAGAALIPERLPGPGGTAILPAGYEGYTGGSWQQLQATSGESAGYIGVIFRLYGVYIVAFSVLAIAIAANGFRRGERWAWWALLVGNALAWPAAMSYDLIVHAIGPFELTEYVGLGIILGSLAVTWHSMRPREGSERMVDASV